MRKDWIERQIYLILAFIPLKCNAVNCRARISITCGSVLEGDSARIIIRYKFILDYAIWKRYNVLLRLYISSSGVFHYGGINRAGIPPAWCFIDRKTRTRCSAGYASTLTLRSAFFSFSSSLLDRFSSFAAYYPFSIKLEPASSVSQWTRPRFVIVVALIAVLCAERIVVTA